MADTQFGTSVEGGYFIIDSTNTGSNYQFSVYKSSATAGNSLLAVSTAGTFGLGNNASPDFEVDWSNRRIKLSANTWYIQHRDPTSTSADINIVSNDDINIYYGAVPNSTPQLTFYKASTPVINLNSAGETRFLTTANFEASANFNSGLRSRFLVVCDRDQDVSPTRPGICVLTDTAGTKEYLWRSTNGALRRSTSQPISSDQNTLGNLFYTPTVTEVSNHHSASFNETVAISPATGPKTVTLPSASGAEGGIVIVKNRTLLSTVITISPTGSDTIDNASSITISSAYGFFVLQSDGVSKWWIIGK